MISACRRWLSAGRRRCFLDRLAVDELQAAAARELAAHAHAHEVAVLAPVRHPAPELGMVGAGHRRGCRSGATSSDGRSGRRRSTRGNGRCSSSGCRTPARASRCPRRSARRRPLPRPCRRCPTPRRRSARCAGPCCAGRRRPPCWWPTTARRRNASPCPPRRGRGCKAPRGGTSAGSSSARTTSTARARSWS